LLYNTHYRYTFNSDLVATAAVDCEEIFSVLGFNSLLISINELSLVFILLISFLYPVILFLMAYDFSGRQYRFFSYMIWLYLVIYIFIFTADLLCFYIVYEFMIGLVLYIMYLTANSRGGIEAILFFTGWAVIGSFLVGAAVVYILVTVQSSYFNDIINFTFTSDECYFLYFLIFFGFGTKLSI
jgi:NADH:ubiquinone oxidoreductase subunit 4 (subunit M)